MRMRLEGGCYCGALRYVAEGKPVLRAQCHCRACQHVSGGAPNLFMLMPAEGFRYAKGAPKAYRRPDKADAVTREFCAACGTHLITRRPGLPPRHHDEAISTIVIKTPPGRCRFEAPYPGGFDGPEDGRGSGRRRDQAGEEEVSQRDEEKETSKAENV
jgi:hypothetical protein